MASCCDPPGYDDVFDVAFARRLAKRYRRKGLDRTAGRMVEALTSNLALSPHIPLFLKGEEWGETRPLS